MANNDFKEEDSMNLPLQAEDFKTKIGNFFSEYMFFFITLLVCGVYMLKDLFNITETGKTVSEIIADSSVSLLMGLLIARLLGLQGLQRGEKADQYVMAREEHNALVKQITPYMGNLIRWCKSQNENKIIELRTTILSNEDLLYHKYIQGEYKKDKTLTKSQKRAIRRAKHLRITPLSASGLISGETPQYDPFYLGETKDQHLKKETRKTFLSKVLLGILFGYFGVEAVVDVSWASICWRAIQVVIFLASGFSKYWDNYYLMYNNMPIRFKKQDGFLKLFESWNKTQKIEKSEIEESKDV